MAAWRSHAQQEGGLLAVCLRWVRSASVGGYPARLIVTDSTWEIERLAGRKNREQFGKGVDKIGTHEVAPNNLC